MRGGSAALRKPNRKQENTQFNRKWILESHCVVLLQRSRVVRKTDLSNDGLMSFADITSGLCLFRFGKGPVYTKG